MCSRCTQHGDCRTLSYFWPPLPLFAITQIERTSLIQSAGISSRDTILMRGRREPHLQTKHPSPLRSARHNILILGSAHSYTRELRGAAHTHSHTHTHTLIQMRCDIPNRWHRVSTISCLHINCTERFSEKSRLLGRNRKQHFSNCHLDTKYVVRRQQIFVDASVPDARD